MKEIGRTFRQEMDATQCKTFLIADGGQLARRAYQRLSPPAFKRPATPATATTAHAASADSNASTEFARRSLTSLSLASTGSTHGSAISLASGGGSGSGGGWRCSDCASSGAPYRVAACVSLLHFISLHTPVSLGLQQACFQTCS